MLAPHERDDLLGQLAGLTVDVQRWASSCEHRISVVAELIEQVVLLKLRQAIVQAAERPVRRTRAGPRSVA